MSAPRGRPIATRHLAIDDGGTQGLLGTPVRGVETQIKEKTEERRQFGRQMGGEALTWLQAARRGNQIDDRVIRCPRATAAPCSEMSPSA